MKRNQFLKMMGLFPFLLGSVKQGKTATLDEKATKKRVIGGSYERHHKLDKSLKRHEWKPEDINAGMVIMRMDGWMGKIGKNAYSSWKEGSNKWGYYVQNIYGYCYGIIESPGMVRLLEKKDLCMYLNDKSNAGGFRHLTDKEMDNYVEVLKKLSK